METSTVNFLINRARWSLVTSALILPGCAGDSATQSDSAADCTPGALVDVKDSSEPAADVGTPLPAAIPVGEFVDRVAEAYCSAESQCKPSADGFGPPCLDIKGRWGSFDARQRLRLVELGRLTYDGVAAAQCLAQINCGTVMADPARFFGEPGRTWQLSSAPEPCARIFHGTLPLGVRCEDDAECGEGACWGCPGDCRLPVSRGAACGREASCGPADWCLDGTCVAAAPRKAGESCSGIKGGCEPGLTCRKPSAGTHNTCAVELLAGDACMYACYSEDLACLGGFCKYATFGAPCTTTNQCPWQMLCTPDIAGHAQCLPVAWPFEPCGQGFCPSSQHCTDAASGKCAPLILDGAPCDSEPLHCANHCNPSTNRCGPWQICAETSCVDCAADGVGCYDNRVGDACSGDSCDDPDPAFQQVFPMVCVESHCERTNPACAFPPGSP